MSVVISLISMGFWQNVDNELAYLGKSRKELAAEAHFDVSYISKGIERNSIPIADTAVRIARALHVSVEYLLDMETPSKSKTNSKGYDISTDDIEAIKSYHRNKNLINQFEQLPQQGQEMIVQTMTSLQNLLQGNCSSD